MRIRVLGAGAGGGVPQWNCGCPNCREARSGRGRVLPRTEDSLAVSADGGARGGGEEWVLFNASPSIHAQIAAFPALWPRAPRHSPIAAVVLTNGDLDHCLGLFSLRESSPLVVYATDSVFRALVDRNAVARTLQRFDGHLTHRRLELGKEVEIEGPTGAPTGLSIVAHAAAGKLPVHLMAMPHLRASPHAEDALPAPRAEDNIGIWVRDVGAARCAAYVPGAASLDGLRRPLDEAACVFLDGTFFREDELIVAGLGTSSARDMAHLPIGGTEGSLAALAGSPRKIYTHINNTNPILDSTSEERRLVEEAGWEVATDGLEIEL